MLPSRSPTLPQTVAQLCPMSPPPPSSSSSLWVWPVPARTPHPPCLSGLTGKQDPVPPPSSMTRGREETAPGFVGSAPWGPPAPLCLGPTLHLPGLAVRWGGRGGAGCRCVGTAGGSHPWGREEATSPLRPTPGPGLGPWALGLTCLPPAMGHSSLQQCSGVLETWESGGRRGSRSRGFVVARWDPHDHSPPPSPPTSHAAFLPLAL